MDRTDLSLILGAFSAIAVFSNPAAAQPAAAFVAGVPVGQRRRSPP
jgi:hypothetical protein